MRHKRSNSKKHIKKLLTLGIACVILASIFAVVLIALPSYNNNGVQVQNNIKTFGNNSVNANVSFISLINASRSANHPDTFQWVVQNNDSKDHDVAPLGYLYNGANVLTGTMIAKTTSDPCSTCQPANKTQMRYGVGYATVPAHSTVTFYCDGTPALSSASYCIVNARVMVNDASLEQLLYPRANAYVLFGNPVTVSSDKLRIAIAGDPVSFTTANLDWAKQNGVSEIHLVPYSLYVDPNLVKDIHNHGMTCIVDIQVPLWVGRGFSSTPFSETEISQLRILKGEGIDGLASEGLFRVHVQQINSLGVPFIDYGSEVGQNLLEGTPNIYQIPLNGTVGWYQEVYDLNLKSNYFQTIEYAAIKTHSESGFTSGVWVTLGQAQGQNPLTQGDTLLQWISELYRNYNVRVSVFLFWTGSGYSAFPYIMDGGIFHNVFVDAQHYTYPVKGS